MSVGKVSGHLKIDIKRRLTTHLAPRWTTVEDVKVGKVGYIVWQFNAHLYETINHCEQKNDFERSSVKQN